MSDVLGKFGTGEHIIRLLRMDWRTASKLRFPGYAPPVSYMQLHFTTSMERLTSKGSRMCVFGDRGVTFKLICVHCGAMPRYLVMTEYVDALGNRLMALLGGFTYALLTSRAFLALDHDSPKQ